MPLSLQIRIHARLADVLLATLTVAPLLAFTNTALARQIATLDPDIGAAAINWQALADSTIGADIAEGEAPGAVVLVVDQRGETFVATYGVCQTDAQLSVTDSTLFEVGSIGKVVTAIATLQLVDRGLLDLHADLTMYLDGWELEPPGETPLTIHHLLTHSGGLNDRAIGYAQRTADGLPTLDDHLRSSFPTFFAEPGAYISYSNYGFGLAGYLVERASGLSFAESATQTVLRPLGMRFAGYGADARGTRAVGYAKRGDSFEAAPTLHRPVTPAGSLLASALDMRQLLLALLNEGEPVLAAEETAQMLSVQQTMHPALMGNTFGLEESRWGTVRGFGKGGSVPGFVSYMAVLPEQGIGLFASVNASNDAPVERFVFAATRALAGADAAPQGARAGGSQMARPAGAIDASAFAGEYRSNRYDRTSVEKLLNFEVRNIYETGEGNLALWHDGAMNVYVPEDNGLFRHETDPQRALVFEAGDDGNVTHAFFNDRIAGGYVPVVWERTGFFSGNGYVNEIFGVVLLVALAYLVWPIVGGIRLLRRRSSMREKPRQRMLRRAMHLAGFLTSAALLAYTVLYFIPLLRARPELVFGLPSELAPWAFLPALVVVGFLVYAVLWLLSFRSRAAGWKGVLLSVLPTTLFLISGVLVTEFFVRWNLL